MNKSILIALASLGIMAIAMISMFILIYMTGSEIQPGSSVAVFIITFFFFWFIARQRFAWLWGRILGFITAIVLTIIALICLVFFGDRPYMLPTIILIALQAIFLFVMYFSLDTVEARKYFNVLCSECGKSKIKASDINFTKVICRKCGKEWS